MTMMVFAVRDSAVDAFMNPFVAPAAGAAIRSFTDEVNRPSADNAVNKHADDYDLYHIGSYIPGTGALEACPPRLLIRGKDALRPAS